MQVVEDARRGGGRGSAGQQEEARRGRGWAARSTAYGRGCQPAWPVLSRAGSQAPAALLHSQLLRGGQVGKVGGADGLAVRDLQSQLLAPRLAQGLQRGRRKGDGGGKRGQWAEGKQGEGSTCVVYRAGRLSQRAATQVQWWRHTHSSRPTGQQQQEALILAAGPRLPSLPLKNSLQDL